MRNLGSILSSHSVYFIGYAIILILLIFPQVIYDQKELFLIINNLHNPVLDFIFKWLTHLGDGLFFTVLVIVFLFKSYGKALTGLIVFLSTSLIAQLLKRVFFPDTLRPFAELASSYNLHVPEGVDPIRTLSFPSGHTVTAFAIAAFYILITSRKNAALLVLIMAWLVGYSRIYLTHHYPIDVWVGSVIGTLGALLIYWLFNAKLDNRFGNRSLLNR